MQSNLYGSVFDGYRAGDFSCTTTIDDTVVFHQVADNAKSVVKRSFSLVDDLDRNQSSPGEQGSSGIPSCCYPERTL